MEAPYILHMLSPDRHVSPFDVNMALDAGFTAAVPYIHVEEKEVAGLVQDAIFSRGPKKAKRTGVFIGGKQAGVALDMLKTARNAMFPPFEISVFADPAGSFTTAAAMVACAEKALRDKFGGDLSGRRVTVFGATGVVGFAAGVIAAEQGADSTMVGYDGIARVQAGAEDAEQRFGIKLKPVDGSTEALKQAAVGAADVIFCAGRAGVQVLNADQVAAAGALKVAADINAVPPVGIEGIGVQDDGTEIAGTGAVGIGALTVGNIKYQVQFGLFQRMIESDKPLYIDFRDAFSLAREILA